MLRLILRPQNLPSFFSPFHPVSLIPRAPSRLKHKRRVLNRKMGSNIPESAPPPLPPKVTVLSVRTGTIRPLGGVPIASGIHKQPRRGPIHLTRLGFAGDERAYVPHQSPDNAVHQYDSTHYARWKTELSSRSAKFFPGAFGENITTAGSALSEANVCVGDVFRLGTAVVQVTMSRQPCYKLNHRFEHRKMASLAQSTGRTGWLYRVLEEGWVEEGCDMELVQRVNPTWPLSRLQYYLYTDRDNREVLKELVELSGLSKELVGVFQDRLRKGAEDMKGRLEGDVSVPWRSYTLVEKTPLTSRIQKFVFLADDDEGLSFEELKFGPFPHVRVKFGPESKFTRAYSVVSGDMKRFEIGVARDDNSRGGSVYLHDTLRIGDSIKVAKGHASPQKWAIEQHPQKTKHIFILGGIGITAFLGEIRTLVANGNHTEIHYAVRRRSEAAYLDHLPKAHTNVYSKVEGERLSVADIIPSLDVSDNEKNANPPVVIYCCGPPSMIEETQKIAKDLGYPRSHIYVEEFGGLATGTGDPFEVEVEATGKVFEVPREKSLLEVLNEAGFDIDSSCLTGNCGTCTIDYCKGEVVHQGVALDDQQKQTSMLSCVSRGKGRITVKY